MMTTTQQTQQQRIKAPSEALPSDGLSRFVRAGAWAAMVSGLALVASLLMEWLVVPYERLGHTEAYFTSAYHVSSGLRLFSIVLLLWTLIGIYGPQSRAAGTSGCGRSSRSSSARRSQWATSGQRCPGGARESRRGRG
jgi:hypothetical protein